MYLCVGMLGDLSGGTLEKLTCIEILHYITLHYIDNHQILSSSWKYCKRSNTSLFYGLCLREDLWPSSYLREKSDQSFVKILSSLSRCIWIHVL